MNLSIKIHVPDNLVIDDEQKAGQEMAEAVRGCIRQHLSDKGLHTAPNRYGLPHSGYWHKAANTVRVESQQGLRAVVAAGAESDNPKAPGHGIALHYYGGVVYPTGGRKALAIPISTEVARKNPREVNKLTGGIALVWPKNSSHGFLKDENTNELLWLLIPKATIKADKTVLPTDDEMRDAAMDGLYARIEQEGRT